MQTSGTCCAMRKAVRQCCLDAEVFDGMAREVLPSPAAGSNRELNGLPLICAVQQPSVGNLANLTSNLI
jgi:hypothetical protein